MPLVLAACLGPVHEPPAPSYHNPLDVLDAGPVKKPGDGGVHPTGDGGLPPGATVSLGSVDGRAFELTSAIYQVLGGDDAGPERTLIYLSDAPRFCAQLADGGPTAPWNVVALHLAGDLPATYPIATPLPPEGATAEFDWEDGDGGGFGFETGLSGQVQLEAVDPLNAQTTLGTYTVGFGDAGSIVGRFTASPCAGTPPPPGA
ncbi:MAG TPA: hypothetical protein VMB50_12390 [Myxococcales bacterium]|nr:hypothetical protein [Myxococcales bacterium]